MKTLILVTVFLMLARVLLAPEARKFFVEKAEKIDPYKAILKAMATVESSNNTYAYNPTEQSTGLYQIRPIRLRDYNRRTGEHLKMNDMYNPAKAERVIRFYCHQYGPYRAKEFIKSWNCNSEKYYQKVKKAML